MATKHPKPEPLTFADLEQKADDAGVDEFLAVRWRDLRPLLAEVRKLRAAAGDNGGREKK